MKTFTYNKIEELDPVVEFIQKDLSQRSLILLTGDLGAGKTTFVQRFCSRLGFGDEVVSPTFSLHQIYKNENWEIDHLDFYRLKTREEIDGIGFWELFAREKFLVMVEWPQLIAQISIQDLDLIRMHFCLTESRQVSVEKLRI